MGASAGRVCSYANRLRAARAMPEQNKSQTHKDTNGKSPGWRSRAAATRSGVKVDSACSACCCRRSYYQDCSNLGVAGRQIVRQSRAKTDLGEGLQATVRAGEWVGGDGSGLCLLVASCEDSQPTGGGVGGRGLVQDCTGQDRQSIDKTGQRQDGGSDNQC